MGDQTRKRWAFSDIRFLAGASTITFHHRRNGPTGDETRFFYGYLIVGTSSIQMMFLSCMFAYGVLFKELESEFGWSRAAIAGRLP